MFPDLEFIKTCLNGLRSKFDKLAQDTNGKLQASTADWNQNDPDALDYVKGRTHYEANGKVVQLPSKFLPSPTSNTAGAIKADTVKTTDIQPVRLGADGKLYSSGVPIFTTSGNGKAYTANVPEITELVNGILVVMIPHVSSSSTAPTLNINGLGAYEIRRFLSTDTNALNSRTGIYSNWLNADVPVILMYNSGFWYACSFTKPDAFDLHGITSVVNGGTGRQTLSKGSYIIGNGLSSVQQKTPSEVLADIGAIPVPQTASVGQTVAVKAVDENGKPTEWEPVTLPEKMPNPNALTFTGAVSGSYDGSAPLSVEIPAGGGGSSAEPGYKDATTLFDVTLDDTTGGLKRYEYDVSGIEKTDVIIINILFPASYKGQITITNQDNALLAKEFPVDAKGMVIGLKAMNGRYMHSCAYSGNISMRIDAPLSLFYGQLSGTSGFERPKAPDTITKLKFGLSVEFVSGTRIRAYRW